MSVGYEHAKHKLFGMVTVNPTLYPVSSDCLILYALYSVHCRAPVICYSLQLSISQVQLADDTEQTTLSR